MRNKEKATAETHPALRDPARRESAQRKRRGRVSNFELRVSTFVILLLLVAGRLALATTLTGTFKDAAGNAITGSLVLTLSQPAIKPSAPQQVVPLSVSCTITNGVLVPPCGIEGNDVLSPSGTYYHARLYDGKNRQLWEQRWTIQGASVDVGTLEPALITAAPSGAVTKSQLPASVAYEDEANTFTGGTQTVNRSVAGSAAEASAVAVSLNTSAGTTTNAYGYKVTGITKSGGGSIMNAYGLNIPTLTAGTKNWGIWSGPANSSFGGVVQEYGYFDAADNVFALKDSAKTSSTAVLGANQRSSAGTQIVGVFGVAETTHASGSIDVSGVEGDAYNSGNGDVNYLRGVTSYVEKRGTGTAQKLISFFAYPNFRTAGTVVDNYGIFVDDQSGVGTNNWAIYTAGAAPSHFGGKITAQGLNNVRFCDQFAGADAGAKIAACIADLPSTGGTADARGLEGAQTISSTIMVIKPALILLGPATFSWSGVGSALNFNSDNSGILGSGEASVIRFDSSKLSLLDAMDATTGWAGTGVAVSLVTTASGLQPAPREGSGYIQAAVDATGNRQVAKTISPTNFIAYGNIAVWHASNKNVAQALQFFVSDGTNTSFWNLTNSSLYAQWKQTNLAVATPDGNDGAPANLTAITRIGFRSLAASTNFYFDAVQLFNGVDDLIAVNSNSVSIRGLNLIQLPAGTGSAISFLSTNHNVRVTSNRIEGGSFGIWVGPNSSDNWIAANTVTKATNTGIRISGGSNQVESNNVSDNVVGIWTTSGADGNSILSNRLNSNNQEAIAIQSQGNTVSGNQIDTWSTFGIYLVGSTANYNVVTGNTLSSSVGGTAIQTDSGASYNSISVNMVKKSGGNGIDLNGSSTAVVANSISGNTIMNTGANVAGGGTNEPVPEGHGIILNQADKTTVTGNTVTNAGQAGPLSSGAEGIAVTDNSGVRGDLNQISGNVVTGSVNDGITIFGGEDNEVSSNTVAGNSGYGINVNGATAVRTLITGNKTSSNTLGAIHNAGTNTRFSYNDTGAAQELMSGVEFLADIVLPNATALFWRDSGGLARDILKLQNNDDLVLFNPIAGKDTFLGAGGVNTVVQIQSTGAIVNGNLTVGDGSGNDHLGFTSESTNPACAAGDYRVWANSVDLKLKKCENGTVTDLDTGGAGGPHNLLSATHTDTVAAAPIAGDLLYANSTPAWTKLGAGSSTQLLHSGTTPSWGAVSLTADVSGTLAAANGGTGIAYFAVAGPTVARTYTFPDANATIEYQANKNVASGYAGLNASALVDLARGGTNQSTWTAAKCLRVNDAGTALESAAADCGSGGGAHNLLSATHSDTLAAAPVAGDLLYANSTPAWTKLGAGSSAQLLHSGTTPSWGAVSLTADVAGILPTANGGTGIAYFTAAGPTVARTYTFPDANATIEYQANKNVASGYAGLTASTKVALAQGQEVWGLNDLSDVAITSPATAQTVRYSGSSWVNAALACADVTNCAPLVASGTAGTGPSKVGTASTAARSDHDHRSIHSITWFFPGTPATGVQNMTLVLPEGIVNPAILDLRVTVNTPSASSSTFNIQRCTASCTGTSPTFANIYSTNLTLSASTRTASKAAAPDQNVSGLAAGDQFKANLVTIGSSLADVTVTMTVKYDTTN